MEKMMNVISVYEIDRDIFKVVVGNDSGSCEAICKLSTDLTSAGEKLGRMDFDSPEFNTLMMRGEIDFKEVRQAIRDAKGKGNP